MFAGTEDVSCAYDSAVTAAGVIGAAVTYFESIEGADHMYFSSANSDWFMSIVKEQLQVPKAPLFV